MQLTFKCKIDKALCSNLVYTYQCNICSDIWYGKTIKHFKVRAGEHLSITHLTWTKVKNLKESTIFGHILHTSHNPSSDDSVTLI